MNIRTLLPLLLMATSTQAGTPSTDPVSVAAESSAEAGWWFRAAPYGWVTAIEGDMRIGPLSAPVEVSMEDTLKDLDMAAMGILEAGYSRWSLGVDITYAKVSEDLEGGGRLFRSFRLEQKQWVINPALAYRLIETGDYFMEVFGGVRINVFEADLTGRFARGGQETRGARVD